MCGERERPTPKCGLTWEPEKTVVVAAAAPVDVPDIVREALFPELPLSAPFGAVALTQVFLDGAFDKLYRPVERVRLIWFVTATVLAASAAMTGVVLAVSAMGWVENGLPTALASFGGTMFVFYHIHKWLFTAMIERHGSPLDGEEEMT